LIKSKSRNSVAATVAKLARNLRLVFDYLRMTDNSIPDPKLRALTSLITDLLWVT